MSVGCLLLLKAPIEKVRANWKGEHVGSSDIMSLD